MGGPFCPRHVKRSDRTTVRQTRVHSFGSRVVNFCKKLRIRLFDLESGITRQSGVRREVRTDKHRFPLSQKSKAETPPPEH